jgi:hypothetical protein
MTRIKHLAVRLFEILSDGFAGAAPYFGAPATMRMLGMPGPLPYTYPRRTNDER